ncbi:MAG: ATPase [Candidatus Niyogibacteria bacterium CG10_big_fil_rev_8_21_14_0_10_42_19]|uniref:ATPase n=1 Tax=Candidatus Niyogibacteria bacterium CG10_big_fil_rev_8_21_14_0_10_42_19 TaxID=1974725 RepID=A0A2H0TFV8_9BACT|nr:MAG: ATPase [Candidatus Niyogibacteria bacterium CG10_big_fil_rev_8_21_14_0_10_42_19]
MGLILYNKKMETNILWHAEQLSNVIKALKTDPEKGLSSDERAERLKKFGPNQLEAKQSFRFFRLLWEQVKSPLVFILIIAGVITYLLNEMADTIVIFTAVGINTFIGMYQEGKASKAFEHLKKSIKKHAVLISDGKKFKVEITTLIPGDIVVLESGDQVPADMRLLEIKGLEVNEAVLTGEWMPRKKNIESSGEKARITEQNNMAWMGTLVEDGWAKGVVVSTGKKTQFGEIASLLSEEEKEFTPFQIGAQKLAKIISSVILVIISVIFTAGVLKGDGVVEMFKISVAIAVAAIPEGLPVAVTVVLAISMSRILQKGGLVKRLVKAETLGSTTVILTDKTGTLTLGEMDIAGAVGARDIKGGGENIKTIGNLDDPSQAQKMVLKTGIFTSAAFVENDKDDQTKKVIRGRPTDKALLKAGIGSGLDPEDLLKEEPRLDFMTFESQRRFAASLNKTPENKNRVYITGAPELIFSSSSYIYDDGEIIPLVDAKSALSVYESSTGLGMRVVATAYKDVDIDELPRKDFKDILSGLVFTGLIGFHDPVRKDVPGAMAQAMSAGLYPILVTGDHANTALAVAREIGLKYTERAITGEELEKMNVEEIREILKNHQVFARVLPHQKMGLVEALHLNNEIVAMTGDGVNDAPALKKADIGIAVGSGTDVAKEASDLILLEDSFSVIVSAIEGGRVILDNLRKVVTFVLSAGFSEVILIGGAILAGLPLPVLPVQILWANIVEEGFMNFALAFEPKEDDIMARHGSQLSPTKIINKEMHFIIFGIGIITSLLLFGLYLLLLSYDYPIEHARTILFAGLSIDALFFVFSLKSLRKPIWKINLFSNLYLIAAFFLSLLFLVGALVLPFLQALLQTVTPSLEDALIIVGLGIINFVFIEIAKWYFIVKGEA